MVARSISQSSDRGSNLADILERILDKGIVIAGDIEVRLVNIELLTIQIRLIICSMERAQEAGLDFWKGRGSFIHKDPQQLTEEFIPQRLGERLDKIENTLALLAKGMKT